MAVAYLKHVAASSAKVAPACESIEVEPVVAACEPPDSEMHEYRPRDCGGACEVCGCEKNAPSHLRTPFGLGGPIHAAVDAVMQRRAATTAATGARG